MPAPPKSPSPINVQSSIPQNQLLRSFVSLGLVLHFLCVFFVLSSNVRPSQLQQRLAGILAPYTQVFHFDPGFARLQFTDGSEEGEDHVVSILPRLGDGTFSETGATRMPASGGAWNANKSRELSLAFEMGAAAAAEADAATALYARSVAARYLKRAAIAGEKNIDHVLVRVERLSHPFEYYEMIDQSVADGKNASPTRDTKYEAEVWLDEDGQLQVLKRSSGRESAPTTGSAGERT